MTHHEQRRLTPRVGQAAALALMALASLSTAALAKTTPLVEVDADSRGASGVIHASVEIAAPRSTVWRVLTDCAAAPQLMVNLKSCRVTRQDRAGLWDERETISRGSLLPGVRTVMHAEYDAPARVRFHAVGGDLKLLEGEWRLEPIDGGAGTRVTYDSRVTASFIAPGPLVRAVLRRDMPRTLSNLRDACEAIARP